MKPAPSTLERETTLPAIETMEFGIGDPRVVMEINAGQYSDIETAIIREYSTNAYDAHVMAGHDDPIEVSLPSVLNPYFEVRDHGVGMNRDTFRQVYTQFGISDKRERNDANGQMGIGSKSGVAYTTQFRVTSVMDGIKVEAKIRRGDDWSLYLDVLSEDFTDEHNGTVIRIPIHNVDEFCHKAHQFYKFWLPGRVLIDGKPSVHHVGQKIADNLYYSREWATSYVVLANAPYRINNPAALFRDSKLSSLNFVAYVDDIVMTDGAAPIQFTPSREDLKYTERTKATLQGIINKFEADLVSTAQNEVNSATTHAEAYTAWAKWRNTLNGSLFTDLTFKGDKFRPDFAITGHKYNPRGGRYSVEAIRNWGVEQVAKTLFVTDFHITTSSSAKVKAKAYIEQEFADDERPTLVVFTPQDRFDASDSVWVDWKNASVVSWADLKAALPKTLPGARNYVPGSGRVPGSWDYWTRDGQTIESPVPTDKTLLWIAVKQSKNINVRTTLKMLESDAVVLVVPMNRLAKLKRDFPQIQAFTIWGRAQVQTDGAKLLSREAKRLLDIDYDFTFTAWLDKLDIERLDDPDFKNAKALFARKDELLAEYKKHQSLASHLRMGYNGSDFKKYESGNKDIYSKYPLLRSIGHYGNVSEDIYLYLNAKHKAESEKK